MNLDGFFRDTDMGRDLQSWALRRSWNILERDFQFLSRKVHPESGYQNQVYVYWPSC